MHGEIRLKRAARVLTDSIDQIGYSARDFAREAQLPPSSLSEILSGKTRITLHRIVELGFLAAADIYRLVLAAAQDLLDAAGSDELEVAELNQDLRAIEDLVPRDPAAAELRLARLLHHPEAHDRHLATALALLGHVASFRHQFSHAKVFWNAALSSGALDAVWETNARLSYGEALLREGRLIEARGVLSRALDGTMEPWQRAYGVLNLNDALVRDAHALESLTPAELGQIVSELEEAKEAARTHPPLYAGLLALRGFMLVFATVVRRQDVESADPGFRDLDRAIELSGRTDNPIWNEVWIKARLCHALATAYRYPEEAAHDPLTLDAIESLAVVSRDKRLPALFREVQEVKHRVLGASRAIRPIGAAILAAALSAAPFLRLLALLLLGLGLVFDLSWAWPCLNTENQLGDTHGAL
ncbi:MAG: hypothetical protein IT349_11415 [Candidatus Eisenbacteria bacterium]|nr:hypothetical protein [Candidatus Eisenbacteria bacterium]MCC7142697.1 hypothetical protein [Candidatus Eisenbacteria bacterium]